MARDKLTFRERDLKTAVKVLQASGLRVSRVDVRQDGVTITLDGDETAANSDTAEDLRTRKVLENAAKRAKET